MPIPPHSSGIEHAEQAELAHLAEQVGRAARLLPRQRGPRGDLLLGEVAAEPDQVAFGFGEREVHRAESYWTDRYNGRTTRRMASDRTPHTFPKFDHVEDERRHRKQRLAAAFRLFGHVRLRRGHGRPHHRPRPRAARPLLGQPARHELQADPGEGPAARERPGRGRRGHLAAEHGGVRDPLADPRRPPRRRRRRPLPLGATARRGRRCAARSIRSPRTPARSTTTTSCSTTTPAWCSTSRRASASPTPSVTHKAAILANHGLLTVGRTVDEAAWWFITMERSCQAQLLAEAAGHAGAHRPRARPQTTAAQVGGHRTGWLSVPAALRLDRRRAARPPRRVALAASEGPAVESVSPVLQARSGVRPGRRRDLKDRAHVGARPGPSDVRPRRDATGSR